MGSCGIWCDRAARHVGDEAPAAYEDVAPVMRAQHALTRIVRRLRPLSYERLSAVSFQRTRHGRNTSSAHLTVRHGVRHIDTMPRDGVSDDERAFRSFLSARGFDDDVMAVAFQLYRTMQEAIARAETEVLRPLGLSWVGYVTLMGLWVRRSAEVRALARMQVASKPAVVKSLDGLERRRLVRRRRSARDRRLVDVELTPAGRALVQKAQREVHRREHRLTGRLTVAEKRLLAKLLRKLDTSLAGR